MSTYASKVKGGTLILWAALGPSLLLAFHGLRYYGFTIDDTYISLVYVRNLLEGNGLTYNGLRVEGFSNFLWVLLVTGGTLLFRLDPIVVAKGLGFLIALASPGLVVAVATAVGRPLAGVLAAFWLALNPFYAVWSMGGLETPLYASLILVVTLLYLRAARSDRRKDWLVVGGGTGLAALTRPEGFLLAGVVALHVAWRRRAWLSSQRRRDLLPFVAGWATIVAPAWGFRWGYYGHFWPAPVYAKMGGGSSQILAGLNYGWDFLQASHYWPLLALLWVPFHLHGQEKRYQEETSFLILLSGLLVGGVIAAGGDWMPAFRFFVPVLPLLYLMVAITTVDLLAQERCRWRWRRGGVAVVAIGAALASLAIPDTYRRAIRHAMATADALPQTGMWLAQHAEPGSLLAVVDAGAIPYYSGLPTIDMVGLNDYHIARLPGGFMAKYDIEYILARRPAYIQIHAMSSASGKGRVVVDFIGAFYLYYSSEFQQWYDLIPEVPWTQLYRRREKPRAHTFLDNFYSVEYTGYPLRLEGKAGTSVPFTVRVTNTGTGVWTAGGGDASWGWVRLGYQFLTEEGSAYPTEPARVSLPYDLAPGETAVLSFPIVLPEGPGLYHLRIDLVAEALAWFSSQGAQELVIPVNVR
ncbi:MAG: hypothetical protein D6759_11150 [Chloroflexi bacterium]|nr:MAG: hypothetical protein D6759_11150 [Chloroflexota bacterium]